MLFSYEIRSFIAGGMGTSTKGCGPPPPPSNCRRGPQENLQK